MWRKYKLNKLHQNIKRWYHGIDGWKYSKDAKAFVIPKFHQAPDHICLGDRYIHAQYGRDSYGIIWSGCTSTNWHGWEFSNMGQALEWVRQAQFKQFDYSMWSTEKEFNKYLIKLGYEPFLNFQI